MNPTQPWTGSVPIDSIVPNPDQPRKHFDEERLAATARSCGVRQIQPVNVIAHEDPDRSEVRWMLIDGERRWRGLRALGATTIKIAYDPAITREHLFEASFAANFCREGHTKAETCDAVARLIDAGKSQGEIATMIGKAPSWVSDFCIIRALHPRLLKAMDFPPQGERKLPMSAAKLIATLPPFDQLGAWNKVKDLPATEGFHKLRTSGKVRHAARRCRADDADYAEGRAGAVLRQVTSLADLPLPMLKSLSPANLRAIIRILGRIDSVLATTKDRFTQALEQAEDKAA